MRFSSFFVWPVLAVVGLSCDTPRATGSIVQQVTCCELCSVCGNGAVEAGEECDDGNDIAGAGCSPLCRIEGCCDGGDGPDHDDGDDCVACMVPAECSAMTACISGDHCCPSGCGAGQDDDCIARCGNGVCEPGEGGPIADRSALTSTVAACPSDC